MSERMGTDPNNVGIEVVGNPKSDDKLVYCSKREWEWWVGAVDDAQKELERQDTKLERLQQALAYIAAYDAKTMGQTEAKVGPLYGFAFGAVQEHARAALAGEEEG